MFSVVIPLYNKEKQIKRTLDTVLNQSYINFEIVIVNDGSTDKSAEVVRGINDTRIRLIDQKNGGVSAARNRGIKESKNKWIAFLDADDLWEKTKLDEIANVVIKNQEIEWLVTGCKTLKGNETRNFLYKNNGFLEDALDDLWNGLYIHTSSVVVKRENFIEDNNLLFSEGISHSEDREVWYKLMFKYPKLYYLRIVLATYIRDTTGNSLTSESNYEFNFLNLQNRLSQDISKLPSFRRKKFEKNQIRFNKRALLTYWINYGITDYHKEMMSSIEIWLLSSTNVFPKISKKIIVKILVMINLK